MEWESISIKRRIQSFIYYVKYPVLVWGITCFIFVLLLFFLKFPLIILSYGIALSFLCLAAWLTSQWFSLKKKLKLITYLDDTTLVANRNRIHEKDLLMRAYLNHYEKRLIEQTNERQRYQQHLEEQKDYFTLWLHQIKTPISSISLILQQDSVKDSQQKINHELIYLNDYTHMGLNYLKLADTGHELDITSVAVDPLIKNILKKYASLFIYNHIQLNYSRLNLTVLSDAKWLQTLLEQIISNSLKYTPDGGNITIELQQDSIITIKDSGIGIHPNDLPKIFEKGYSGLNGRLHDKSTGLGLFLARKICRRLNFTIKIESEVGKGTTVYLDTRRESIELFD